jgi:predicted transcriptional regulator
VGDALERIRKQPHHILYYLYIVDREDKLVGVLTMRELLQSESEKMLSEVMNTDISSLPIQLSYRSILIHPGWQDYHALPVIDQDGILVGAIGYRTLKALQKKSLQDQQPGHLSKASLALGELYWLALSGLLKASISVFQKTNGSLGTKASRSERHEA